MQHKPVIFIDFKKNSRLCKNIRNGMLYKNMISMLLTFLKTHFHIVYILGNFFQKIIKHYKLSQYLVKFSNTKEDYSYPTCVIFIKQINSLIGHYSLKIYINNRNKVLETDNRRLNVHVDYLSYGNFWKNYNRISKDIYRVHSSFAKNIIETLPKSIIVFDLDETIIDQDYCLVCSYVKELLQESRAIFDYMVLWSHGNTSHVQRSIKLYEMDKLFDLVLTRGRFQYECFNKGFGLVLKHLNKNHGISNVKYSVLVDDQEDNFNNDYSYYIKVDKAITNTQYKKKFTILKECIENRYGNTKDRLTLHLLDV